MTKRDVEMFHDEYWKPIYFGVSRPWTSHKNSTGVDLCILVIAGFL